MTLPLDPLFEPLTVGNLTMANRFVMAPMTRGFSPGGVPGSDVVEYYRRRAGLGLIVSEGVGVDHPAALGVNAVDGNNIPVLHGDAAMTGWRKVTDAVHAAGGKIMPQLWHQGVMRREGTGPHPNHPSTKPSGIWGPEGRASSIPPDEMIHLVAPTKPASDSEIADVIAAFVRSAINARAAGFDGIALHGAHGYLIDTFLWHESNVRTDRWGGKTLAERGRFAIEIIKGIRAAIGPDMPIMFRFSQWKQQDFGGRLAATADELATLLLPLAEAGVDIFDASQRRFSDPIFSGSPLNLAGWARKLTGRPSCTVGSVGMDGDLHTTMMAGSAAISLDPLLERFAQGEFDLVGVGRSVIADPDFVAKLRNGEPRTRFVIQQLFALN
jgi:2,4-dienoyl-CoA reductase-like NADH-dependent reductase (Old Yellow Enzyme family)